MDTETWTDAIPVCKQAGIGRASNEIYKKDGRGRVEMHPMHDRYFHFNQVDYDLSVYSVIDGFGGSNTADFVEKRLPAELLLGQISVEMDDESVKEILKSAFANVDREYFQSTMESITARIILRYISEHITVECRFNDTQWSSAYEPRNKTY